MKTGPLTHTARSHILLCAVCCLLAIPRVASAQSIAELKSKAEDGDVQAQLALAKAYHLGEGIEKDEAQAVLWWEKAAEHGDVAAQVKPWSCLFAGSRGSKELRRSRALVHQSCRSGQRRGAAGPCTPLSLGARCSKDDAVAVRWYTKAADQGNVQAQSDLAALYHLGGQGVPQDDAAAVRWWKKAADQGDVTAQGNLGTAYGLGNGCSER